MHGSVMKWVKQVVSKIDLTDKTVLEVGSYDVNGSVRPLFEGCREYIGVDMREGPGVDYVMNAHDLRFAPGYFEINTTGLFDIVISTEMLEHDPAFWLSLKEMGRVLKPGGDLILTARGNGFPNHDYPADYWRFMPESFGLLFDLAGCEVVEILPDPDKKAPGVFGWGKRR
jgi:SAM-dependent methyltransferase